MKSLRSTSRKQGAEVERGAWYYSSDHNQPCQVIETQTLWGEIVCRVWLPATETVVRVPAFRLRSLDDTDICMPENTAYVAAAARVADALTQDVLLAPIGSSVIPLPHQIRALSGAISGDRVRYLLADEVGLGKTIEAGLILRELKLRGLVKQTLIVAPRGLVTQWVSEMRVHFGETFHLVLPEDIKSLRRFVSEPDLGARGTMNRNLEASLANPWRTLSQVIVPMDSVKPLDRRRGWTVAQIQEYNRERFEDLVSAGWDLIIVDEAHRLAGSTDQVARFKLGQGLSEAAPYLLLLSATPHQGKTDSFHRLLSLLDSLEFHDVSSVPRERMQRYVIRTEKRRAIDVEGNPLFKPRLTQLVPVVWEARHRRQRLLYEAVTEYVRSGYNQATREKRSYIGFLMLLMQRLVVSSTRAIRATLERRLEILSQPEGQLTLFPLDAEDEWADLDGQEQVDTFLRTRLRALKNERAEVRLLLEAASRCDEFGPDAKAETLLDWLYRLQSEERDPELKVLIFTEFVPTQEMLRGFLTDRGFSVVCLNGSMDMDERRRVQELFAKGHRILISTDAGGEGLNLQFCHVVINYDIPWNPMRLEQRIGRVDRIGQTHVVRALNFILEGSVEYRVLEVLEQKLAAILEELGIDKTGDVLDSAQAGHMFDEMYVEAILNPEKVEDAVDSVVSRIREHGRDARAALLMLDGTTDLRPDEAKRLMTHPLPYWVERMTVNYLKAYGGKAEQCGQTWRLTWPDGEAFDNVVFAPREARQLPAARYLTLEEPRVRGLVMRLPRYAPGQPIPVVSVAGVTAGVRGIWSLWRIAIAAMEWNRYRIMPLFLSDEGTVYMQTARHVWDQLLVVDPVVLSALSVTASQAIYAQLQKAAEEQARSIYESLKHEHIDYISREREKAEYAFAARRSTIDRIGLPQVRRYRLNLLAQEERRYYEQLREKSLAYPEMSPLLVVRVEDGSHERLA